MCLMLSSILGVMVPLVAVLDAVFYIPDLQRVTDGKELNLNVYALEPCTVSRHCGSIDQIPQNQHVKFMFAAFYSPSRNDRRFQHLEMIR